VKALVICLLQGAAASIDADAFVEFASIPAPVGREELLREAIAASLPEGMEPRVDEGGNLLLEIGPGERAARAVLAPIGDPALKVSGIDPKGTLRVRHVERRGAFLRLSWVEGRPVTVLGLGEESALDGVALVNSIHLGRKRPDTIGEAWIRIDVGAESESEAKARDVGEGARIVPRLEIARLADGSCAGWFVGRRACALALAEAAKGLDPAALPARVALVWTTEGGERWLRARHWEWSVPLDAGPVSEPVHRAPASLTDPVHAAPESIGAPGPLTLRTAGLGGPTERVWMTDVALLVEAVREILRRER
jgi:hypothetical protein